MAGDLYVSNDTEVAGEVRVTGNIDSGGFYYGDGSRLSNIGRVIQVSHEHTNAFIRSNVTIPWDDTIPQVGEGAEVVILTFDPIYASSLIVVEASVHGVEQSNTANHLTVCLFRDRAADAIACAADEQLYELDYNGGQTATTRLQHVFSAGTDGPIVLQLRAGVNSGFININGGVGVRRLGGTLYSGMIVYEVAQ